MRGGWDLLKQVEKNLFSSSAYLQVTVSSQTPLLKCGDCRLLLNEVFYCFPESF